MRHGGYISAMQSLTSVSRAIFRIIFRGGTPQRIHPSTGLLLIAIAVFIGAAIGSHRWLFSNGVVQIGLFVFTVFSGGYIGAALLTRKVPRPRLRATIAAVMLLLAASQLFLLIVAAPVALLPDLHAPITIAAAIAAAIGLLIGISNCLRFATGADRISALLTSAGFIVSLAAFYAIMISLLETLFS
jgi:hypothetical protein